MFKVRVTSLKVCILADLPPQKDNGSNIYPDHVMQIPLDAAP